MAFEIEQFLCRSDNFGVLLHDPATQATAAIDAPDADAILAALDRRGWTLTDILITHKHADHIDGLPGLKARFPTARVVGPAREADQIAGLDAKLAEGDETKVGSLTARVIETPGHTAGHIVFVFDTESLLFAGDTLFALGCGRVLETPMPVMWDSLVKLAQLPGETEVYCGHEYTASNAAFALTIEPGNAVLVERAAAIKAARAAGRLTLPTTIALELATNPFLRADEPAVKQAAGLGDADPADVFAVLRERKNSF